MPDEERGERASRRAASVTPSEGGRRDGGRPARLSAASIRELLDTTLGDLDTETAAAAATPPRPIVPPRDADDELDDEAAGGAAVVPRPWEGSPLLRWLEKDAAPQRPAQSEAALRAVVAGHAATAEPSPPAPEPPGSAPEATQVAAPSAVGAAVPVNGLTVVGSGPVLEPAPPAGPAPPADAAPPAGPAPPADRGAVPAVADGTRGEALSRLRAEVLTLRGERDALRGGRPDANLSWREVDSEPIPETFAGLLALDGALREEVAELRSAGWLPDAVEVTAPARPARGEAASAAPVPTVRRVAPVLPASPTDRALADLGEEGWDDDDVEPERPLPRGLVVAVALLGLVAIVVVAVVVLRLR